MSNIYFGLTEKEYQESKPKKDICTEDEDSESSDSFIDSFNNLSGGAIEQNIPNGGFPPLKMCSDDTQIKNLDVKEIKKQGFSSNPNKLSIHKILDESDKTPFFNIPK